MDLTRQSGQQIPFTGPLFLIGMPRSGTKLLLALLNQSPRVAISTLETDFLPYWIENWRSYGDLSDRPTFVRFYNEATKLPHFANLASRDRGVGEQDWYRSCRDYSVAGVFEALIRLEVAASPETDTIWGDKSPSYTRHVELLNSLFPEARFVHIVRDVRDYCLSINKAWGKNMIRAAQRWSDDVANARQVGNRLGNNYIEVRYEDLLADPRSTVERICATLGIDFDEDMTRLSWPTEVVGDARGAEIKRDNVEKYAHQLDPATRRKIEAIAGELLESFGYPVERSGSTVRVGGMRMKYFQLADAINLFRNSVAQYGFFGAIKLNVRSLLIRR